MSVDITTQTIPTGQFFQNLDEAAHWAKRIKNQGMRLVTTNGCFDLLHRGHVTYLNTARQQGDALLIALNTDASVRGLKGASRPVVDEQSRGMLLCNLRSVDGVVLFSDPTPEQFLRAVNPDVHVKGDQYTEDTLPEAPVLRELGTTMAFAPMVDGYSTTTLINRVLTAYSHDS